jgi:serine/threonine-protein kinase
VSSKLSLFLSEVKRRKVYHVAAVYAAVGVAICLAVPDLFSAFDLPSSAARLVIVLIAIGLPIALVLAWAYEVRPEEPRRADAAQREAGIQEPVLPSSGTPVEEGRKSIAVLPFVDMSPDQDQEYFCDGMAEELINALTKVRGLRVAARTSSFHFKARSEDVREIGSRLGVRTVLEGSVRRAEERLRVTAQLVSVEDGYHLWSESYDREMKDVFAIQDEISRSIVDTLRPTLLGGADGVPEDGGRELVAVPTRSLEAYDFYLLGRHYWEIRYKEGQAAALRHFERAAELDPKYALPYTGVADSYTILGLFEYLRPDDARTRARSAARRALELDYELAEAHASMGLYLYWLEWDWERSAAELSRAIELNPDHAKAHAWLGQLRSVQGRFEEASQEYAIAQSIDPLSSYVASLAASVHMFAGDFATASEMLEQVVARDPARDPNVLLATFLLSATYHAMASYDLAVNMAEKALDLSDGAGHFMGVLGCWYGAAGMYDRAQAVLDELRARQGTQHVSPLWLSWIHVGLGEKERALELLAQAFAERSPYLFAVHQQPSWRPLWSELRFRELAGKVGSGVVSRAWERAGAAQSEGNGPGATPPAS